MSKNKNILFITHHNNDFDHFLPLIVKLNKLNKKSVKIIAFYAKGNILTNKLHGHICKKNNLDIDQMNQISFFSNINNLFYRIYNFINTKNEYKDKNINNFKKLKELLNKIFIKYFVLCSIFLISNKKINEYIKSNNINLAIIDQRIADENLIEEKPLKNLKNIIKNKTDAMNYILFRFCSILRKNKIPIFMMPHGPQPILKKLPDAYLKPLNNPFRPDYLVMGSKNEFLMHQNMHGLKSTFYLGDPRFDISWIKYLETCALKVYRNKVKKPKDKKVLLYLMDIFTYSTKGNEEYKSEIDKDILSLVNDFSDLEIWVKHHPRNIFDIPINNFIKKDKRKNIRQFYNETDTNILLASADVCIAALTTTLISPILQKNPVIFYNKGMEKLQNSTSIFDDLKFKASSREELISMYKKIINNGYEIDDSFLKTFSKNVFSIDLSKDSMVERYSEKINEILITDKIKTSF